MLNDSSSITTTNTEAKNSFSSSLKKGNLSALYKDYNPDAFNEAMTAMHFPKGLPLLITNYLDGDIAPISLESDHTMKAKQYANFQLFGRKLPQIIGDKTLLAARLILQGEREGVEKALALVKSRPILLQIETEVEDLLGRRMRGTLLQIAVRAGDINLKDSILDEKFQGITERLIAASHLSDEEIAEQLQCIHSPEALQVNHNKNLQILNAVKLFGQGIIESKADGMNLHTYRGQCQPLIDQLKRDLQPKINNATYLGYAFDPTILFQAVTWFGDHMQKFGSLRDNKFRVFWGIGIKELQSKLSTRDAQVVHAGIGNLIYHKVIPPRSFAEPDTDTTTDTLTESNWWTWLVQALKIYVEQKDRSINNLLKFKLLKQFEKA